VAHEDAVWAAEAAVFVSDLDADSPARPFRLGFDPSGRLLELVAMKARRQYLDLLD
jgi:hypothetical protein